MRTHNIDDALNKVYDLIDKRKTELDWDSKGKPALHTYRDGAFLHYFDTWEDYFGGSLMKPIKKRGDYPEDKMPYMVFAKKGINIPLTKFPARKTYVIIRGQIDFIFEDQDEILEMTEFTTMVVDKNKAHGGMVREDTFVMICEDDLDV